MTKAKQVASDVVTKTLYIAFGVVLLATVLFVKQIADKRDALVMAWTHPEVVSQLEVSTKTEVIKK